MTIDNQLVGSRERDVRNGFTIPPRFTPFDMAAMLGKLPWLLRMGPTRPRITFANYASLGKTDIGAMAAKFASILDPAMSWRDVDWLRGIWKGPLLLKGVLTPRKRPTQRNMASMA